MLTFAASHFEFFFLMHHKSFNPELRVVSGLIDMHQSEIEKLAEKEMVDQIFQFSTSLKNLELSLDEIILLRGISVTFTGKWFRNPLTGVFLFSF